MALCVCAIAPPLENMFWPMLEGRGLDESSILSMM